jgi:hypothetical protein
MKRTESSEGVMCIDFSQRSPEQCARDRVRHAKRWVKRAKPGRSTRLAERTLRCAKSNLTLLQTRSTPRKRHRSMGSGSAGPRQAHSAHRGRRVSADDDPPGEPEPALSERGRANQLEEVTPIFVVLSTEPLWENERVV